MPNSSGIRAKFGGVMLIMKQSLISHFIKISSKKTYAIT